jgi:hypothetical protein
MCPIVVAFPAAMCRKSSRCSVFRLERIRDVLEENQAEHDMLVLGRIHIVAQTRRAACHSFASKPSLTAVSGVPGIAIVGRSSARHGLLFSVALLIGCSLLFGKSPEKQLA